MEAGGVVPRDAPRISPSVGLFAVQCCRCTQWRLIPTKEKYEEIRAHILEEDFFCERGREWRENLSCEDPGDIVQDGTNLWAMDQPGIPQPPPGWQRLLQIRGKRGAKFADVYYLTPSGVRLRSMVQIENHLQEHPQYIAQGVTLAQFSFKIPKPLQKDYVRKRSRNPAPTNNVVHHGDPGESAQSSAARPVDLDSLEIEAVSPQNGQGR